MAKSCENVVGDKDWVNIKVKEFWIKVEVILHSYGL